MSDRSYTLADPLTERETEILGCLAEGLSNQEIANRLHVALTTVKWYNTQIFNKLGVQRRQEAIERAQALGLLQEAAQTRDIPNDLPNLSTPFYGRHQELVELGGLLNDPSVNLITILGAGGMGKTTLAVQLAKMHMARFNDGVYFVPLAPLSNAVAIPNSLGERIGWKLRSATEDATGADAIVQLAEFLNVRSILIVLDNFEHLLEGAPLISGLMNHAPRLKFIVTSREKLNLRGENVYVLGGLPVPTDQEDATNVESVQLFIETARRSRADFEASPADIQTIAEICRLVGGMPLALELAAGWTEALTPQQVLYELQRSTDILETELRDVPERHRSIRATFNYSWSRLTEEEQQVFSKLSIFRGGFSVQTAEAIAGANVRILRRLANKSLITLLPSGRYDTHELLRQFAAERLQESGQFDATMQRFVNFFTDYLIQAREMLGREDRRVYEGMSDDSENIIAVMQHAAREGNIKAISDMAIAFEEFSSVFGRLLEGIQILEQVLEQFDEDKLEGEDRLHYGHIIDRLSLLYYSIDHKTSEKLSDKAISFIEPFGNTLYLSLALWTKGGWRTDGVAMPRLKDLERARQIALDIDMHDQYLAITLTIAITLVAHQHFDEAIAHIEEIQNYPYARETIPEIYTKRVLAIAKQGTGDYETAEKYFLEILPAVESLGEMYMHANILHFLSMGRNAVGDLKAAGWYAAKMLKIHRPARDWQKLGAMYGLAGYSMPDMGMLERAVEVLAFVYENPRTVPDNRVHAGLLLTEFKEKLAKDVYQAALSRSKSHTINGLLEDLVAEFETIESEA